MTDTYVSLDLETTGLNPKKDKIIEIGAIKVCRGEIIDTYSTFLNPGRQLGDTVIQLTGIEQSMLEKAPEPKEEIPKLLSFLEGYPLLGHSILFDYSFLKRAAVNQGLIFEKKGIDTLRIARKYLPELESRRLDYLCRHYGITHKAHRALEDAAAAHYLYGKLKEQFYREGDWENKEFNEAPLFYRVKKEGPVTKHQKERLYQLIAKHKLAVEFEVEKLTKNEASRYTDKILSKYGR